MTDLLHSPRGEPWSPVPAAPLVGAHLEPHSAVPAQHVAQFYESASFLLDAACDFLAVSLRMGQASVVIATPGHRAALDARLVASGVDVEAARAHGRYVTLDAADTLATFIVDGAPDAERFEQVVGGTIAGMSQRHQQVRAFGEMVTLLAADGHYEAAIQLEQLWNGLRQRYGFSLLCGYPMSILGGEQVAELVERICDTHGRVVPAESYTTLVDPDQRQRAIALLQQKAQSLRAEVTERRHAEDALHSLFRISQKLHTTLDLDTLVTQLVEESLRLVGAEGGCAGLRAPEGMVCHSYVRPAGATPLDYVWPPGHGLPGWLLEHRRA